jgi:hypothetical protein
MTGQAYITKYYYSGKDVKAEPLFLSVQVGPSSFMYAISTHSFKNVIELCHVEITRLANSTFDLVEKISFLVNNYRLASRKFEKVNICISNTEFTILPRAYAVEGEIRAYLEFATGADPSKKTLQHNIRNVSFCFALEPELLSYFERVFPHASLRHSGAVNIELFFSQYSIVNQNLYLTIGEGYIELVAKEKNELLFYNVFNCENDEDVLYYFLFMVEQFQLNPLYIKLSLAGERAVSDDLIKSIKLYVKHVDFCVTGSAVHRDGELTTLPQHYYFTLLNQHLCEL